jgi:hypothetical protein
MDFRRFQFVQEPITGTIQMVELNRLGCMKVERLLRNGWNIYFEIETLIKKIEKN